MASKARHCFPGILVLTVLLISAGSSTAEIRYTVAPISPSTNHCSLYDINNAGVVALGLHDGTDSEIMLYRQGVLEQVTSNTVNDSSAQLNNAGDMVWVNNDKDIFYYAAATDTVANLSKNIESERVTTPKINYTGAVIWTEMNRKISYDTYIVLYKDGKEEDLAGSNLFNAGVSYPQINNRNQVVWLYSIAQGDIFKPDIYGFIYLHSNGSSQYINIDQEAAVAPQINDSGHVVWSEWDAVGGDFDIFYYNGTSVKNISQNDDFDDLNPQINSNNQVVWEGRSIHTDIFRWDKGVITNLSNTPDYDDYNPVINSYGMVAWDGFDGHDNEIYLYYNNNKLQLTKNYAYHDTKPLINDRGEIAWSAGLIGIYSTALKNAVYLATPVADTYTYYYKYGSGGDYYTGTVYTHPGIPYYLGYTFYKKNETGETGYYKISGFDYTGDFSLYGQVTVDKYYDAETKRNFKPVFPAKTAGTNHLGSETGYIGVDGVSEYQFGQGYYEADVYDTYTFRYTYGNGDWYQGIVYRNPGEEYYTGWKSLTRNELKVDGYYEILNMAYTGKTAEYKKVYVTRYYDGETKKFLKVLLPAGGTNLLLSETGYVISATAAHYFGKGYYEADE